MPTKYVYTYARYGGATAYFYYDTNRVSYALR